MTLSERIAARYVAATWGQATKYLDTLRKAVEKHGAHVGAWKVADYGNASTILTFDLTTAEGQPKSGKVEFRGDLRGQNNMRTKWVRFDGAFYDSPTKLAAVLAGVSDAKPHWAPGGV